MMRHQVYKNAGDAVDAITGPRLNVVGKSAIAFKEEERATGVASHGFSVILTVQSDRQLTDGELDAYLQKAVAAVEGAR
jgi:hypothetical protein